MVAGAGGEEVALGAEFDTASVESCVKGSQIGEALVGHRLTQWRPEPLGGPGTF